MSHSKCFAALLVAISMLLLGTCAVAQQATITHSSNFRQSRSTGSKILASLDPGDSVTLTSNKKTHGYLPAKTNAGVSGWVWARNVSLAKVNTLKLNVAPALTSAEFTASCDNPAFPAGPAAMDHTGGPGSGDKPEEAAQNEEKNNFCAAGPGQKIAMKDLVQFQRAVQEAGDIPFGPGKVAKDRSALKSIGPNDRLLAADLVNRPDGSYVKAAGLAIVKQRPGTTSGVVFLFVADETGVFNVFVAPEFFEQHRRVITKAKFVAVEGLLQKQRPVIHVMASSFQELSHDSQAGDLQVTSHYFH